jgi:uncharacterized membrane protein
LNHEYIQAQVEQSAGRLFVFAFVDCGGKRCSRSGFDSSGYQREWTRTDPLIAIGSTFASLVTKSFDQIRGSSSGNVGIMSRMLGALQTITSLTASPIRWRALREQVECIAELAARTIEFPHDRAWFESRLTRCAKHSA